MLRLPGLAVTEAAEVFCFAADVVDVVGPSSDTREGVSPASPRGLAGFSWNSRVAVAEALPATIRTADAATLPIVL